MYISAIIIMKGKQMEKANHQHHWTENNIWQSWKKVSCI